MKQWSIKHFDRMVTLRQQGLPWTEVNDYFDEVSLGAIKQAYYRNVPRSEGKPKSRNQYTPISEEKKLKIFDFRRRGLSYLAIAKELNTTRSAIAGACYRWKL